MPSNVTITPSDSARNLGVIFDSPLTMSDHISSRFLSVRDLCRIRNTLDSTTAKTIVSSLIQSKVDYCNSLFLNLPGSQLDRLQLILNSATRSVSKTHRFTHLSPVLKSLHWLKIDEGIHYKIISITYKTLPISLALLSAQCSPYPIKHLHSLIYHCHSQTPFSFLLTQNN